MSIFSFSKKQEVAFPIGQFLRVDIHSHVLPGIDDGAADIDTSIRLLERLHGIGLETVIGTPHIMVDIHRNTSQTIQAAFGNLQAATAGRFYLPDVHYAAEHMLDDGFDALLASKQVVPYGNTPYILVETPYLNRPFGLESLAFQLITMGYKPILAHPERYHYLFGKPAAYEALKDLGFALQLNALSLVGYYGKREKEAANWLVEQQLIDYIATDAHHDRHIKHLANYRISQKMSNQLERLHLRNSDVVTAMQLASNPVIH